MDDQRDKAALTDEALPPQPKKAAGRPTLRTIAEHTGFAVATVSRALADDPVIAERTRKTIARAARELGYVPDRAAQRLRTGRTQVIALVLDPHGEIIDFSGSMISGFSEGVRGTNYHLNLTQYQTDEDSMAPIRNIVRNRLADGLIFARTEPQDPRVQFLLDAGFPFVTHGRTKIASHAWFDHDNARFAQLAVERLVAKGRKRILLVSPSSRYTFAEFMQKGFFEAAQALGVQGELSRDFDLNSPPDQINARMQALLSGPNRPDGVICPGEICAIATNAAIHDSGLALGQDVDIVAKQTSRVFDLFRPRLDTIYEDIAEAGRGMAQALLQQIQNNGDGAMQQLQQPQPGF